VTVCCGLPVAGCQLRMPVPETEAFSKRLSHCNCLPVPPIFPAALPQGYVAFGKFKKLPVACCGSGDVGSVNLSASEGPDSVNVQKAHSLPVPETHALSKSFSHCNCLPGIANFSCCLATRDMLLLESSRSWRLKDWQMRVGSVNLSASEGPDSVNVQKAHSLPVPETHALSKSFSHCNFLSVTQFFLLPSHKVILLLESLRSWRLKYWQLRVGSVNLSASEGPDSVNVQKAHSLPVPETGTFQKFQPLQLLPATPIFPTALPGYVALGKFKKLVVKGLAVAG
jgi:hypothetical protein